MNSLTVRIAIKVHFFLRRNAIKRNAWCAPVCLGLHSKPHFAPFTAKVMEGGMAGLVTEEGEDTSEFQCFPLARFPRCPPLPCFPNIHPCKVSQILPLNGSINNSTCRFPNNFSLPGSQYIFPFAKFPPIFPLTGPSPLQYFPCPGPLQYFPCPGSTLYPHSQYSPSPAFSLLSATRLSTILALI